jgi:5-carboxymethyl-2-hydroxymuconate isomerase
MPHIVVHHSASVDVSALLPALHQTLSQQPTVDPASVKTRALSFDQAWVGQGQAPFVHIEVRLLQGRTPDILQVIKDALVHEAHGYLTVPPVVLTMEIVLMNPELYFKG